MNLNTKQIIHLSLSEIEEYKKALQQYKKDIPQKVMNVVSKASEIGLQGNLKSTKALPVKNEGNKITGGIQTTDPIDTYREFGTGMVGSNNPHIAEYLAKVGWKYYVSSPYKRTIKGKQGWIYPKGNGEFGWTEGIPASKKFYNATKNMQKAIPDLMKQEFSK